MAQISKTLNKIDTYFLQIEKFMAVLAERFF
jgi:hypothetical protein